VLFVNFVIKASILGSSFHRGKPMTLSHGSRVSLSTSDWLKVLAFLVVQSIALIGVGIDMRERLVIVETRLATRDDTLRDLRSEMAELRNEMAELRKK
jgi:hypothetical protein